MKKQRDSKNAQKSASPSSKRRKKKGKRVTHDQFVYLFWSNLVFARSFFRIALDPAVLNEINLDSLELAPTRKPSLDGVDSIGDVFYKFRFKSGKIGAFVVTMEHKAWYDRYVSIQMLRYEVDVLEYMKENAKDFADEEGRLPAPYSILLCQKDCPQLDDVLTRCGGVDHGPHMRFQKVNFNDVPFEKLEGEPFLQTAFALSRFANYVDKKKHKSELLDIFRPIVKLNPEKTENWRYFFTAALNYTTWLMRGTKFNARKFKYELLEISEDFMNCVMNKKLFSEFFYDELAPYREEIAESKKEAAESKKEAAESKKEATESKKEAAESERKNQEILDNLRTAIHDVLVKKYGFAAVPNDVKRKLKTICNPQTLLNVLLFITSQPIGDYEEFRKTLAEESVKS